jgi:hypothetical protein
MAASRRERICLVGAFLPCGRAVLAEHKLAVWRANAPAPFYDLAPGGPGMSPDVWRTSYSLMCQALREFLLNVVESRDHRAAGTVAFQASATLYALLLDHALDRKAAANPAAVGAGSDVGADDAKRTFWRVSICSIPVTSYCRMWLVN